MGTSLRKLPSSVVLLQNRPDVVFQPIHAFELARGVDRQRLDGLLDTREQRVDLLRLFRAYQIHDLRGILVHNLLGVQNARPADHGGGKKNTAKDQNNKLGLN